MSNLYLVPTWFFGYDIILEVVFAVVALLVGLYSYKTYKLSQQNKSKLFSIGFFFISASYFIQLIINFLVLSELNENVCNAVKIINVNRLNTLGLLTYIILYLLGLITLIYMTFNARGWKLYSLLIILSIVPLFAAANFLLLYSFISSLFLFYIMIYYLDHYCKHKKVMSLFTTLAFAFLFIAKGHYIFAVNHSLFYVLGNFLELIAYILILLSLIVVLKKSK